MLRISLSSEAAASLATAFTRAAQAAESFAPSNQMVACAAPPFSFSIERIIRADGIVKPVAALATVLARLILARSRARAGKFSVGVEVTKSASSEAILMIGVTYSTLMPAALITSVQRAVSLWIILPYSSPTNKLGSAPIAWMRAIRSGEAIAAVTLLDSHS